MKKFLVLVIAACVSAQAAEPALKVENAWVFAVPPSAKDTAAFMVLKNTGGEPLKVTGGRTGAARKVSPMVTTNHDGRLGMKDVPAFEVPAGGSVVLKPGGDHLMLYGLAAPLKAGDRVTLQLTVEPGRRTVAVEALVAWKEPK